MKIARLPLIILLLGVVLAACQPASNQNTDTPEPTQTSITPPSTNTVSPQTSSDEKPPAGAASQFETDFSIHSVPYDEILSGGVPKDGIPAIDQPVFVNIGEAEEWLEEVEPVIQVVIQDEAKAYPLQILTWHEIVNDSLAGTPIVVTFCPLCNTAIAFNRTVDGQVLDFGTTGRLRFSNLIMYDRQTETWWQQAEGKGIAGTMTGTQLEFVPAAIISWEEFKAAYPDGQVLSRDTGFSRSYGRNPYIGYDDVNRPPFLYDGPAIPDKLPPVARVLAVELNSDSIAYPYETLSSLSVINDRVGEEEIAVFWSAGTSSALDAGIIAEGRDVGTASAYSRVLDGETLSFIRDGENIIDEQTGSTWNVLGQAVSGELEGQQLSPIVSVNHFWFSWAAFKPETRVYQQ